MEFVHNFSTYFC